MESKKEIYDLLPQHLIPETILIELQNGIEMMLQQLHESVITYPFIAKPDIGMKALGVEKISSQEELIIYFQKIEQNFLIQELILFPKELGVFYCRKPGQERGTITGIVEKEFLYVTGNGVSTLEQLVRKKKRAFLQLKGIRKKFGDKMHEIPEDDDHVILVPFGSHTRGAKFTDRTFKKNNHLIKQINLICRNIPGFYFGRLDIRYNTFDELSQGLNFSIIELNGAGSEPTHMYDPKHSIWFAWREIRKHWKWLFEISKINNARGHSFMNREEGFRMLRAATQLEKQLRRIT